jgi:hypothetical protein
MNSPTDYFDNITKGNLVGEGHVILKNMKNTENILLCKDICSAKSQRLIGW